MYCTNQAEETFGDEAIGPTEIINFHSNRQKLLFKFVEFSYQNELNVTTIHRYSP